MSGSINPSKFKCWKLLETVANYLKKAHFHVISEGLVYICARAYSGEGFPSKFLWFVVKASFHLSLSCHFSYIYR